MGEQKHVVAVRPAKQDRFIHWLIGTLCGLLLIAGIVMNFEAGEQKQLGHVRVTYSKTPTLFISGDYSNWLTFGPLIDRLARYDIGRPVWTIHVSKSGHATIDKKGPLGNHNPLILVLFADNHNAQKEAKQLRPIMKQLKQQEHIQTVNLVGHSSGCNIIYQYLTGPAADHREDYPTTAKFVNIATTYSKAERRAVTRFPQHISVLNIAGNAFNTGGDFGVSVEGDQQLGTMLTGRVDHYQTQILFGGITVIHYLLHQNPRVDRALVDFLWNSHYTPQTRYPQNPNGRLWQQK
ncbi:alpha/beta hydrolase [Furfurilactobacillus sp. WILCCON 0119]